MKSAVGRDVLNEGNAFDVSNQQARKNVCL